ncbi:hypothetical protein C8Q69DRAFT_468420 [Paecilomyces variotii]|uniref:Uncharacterized protein n=1 Tax=Byssochlamys spectabilis TaxID=264951 RepID=A0A443HT26_BYSSP|nr:hypothetical protein C8Q69DRAFT_468420 [Paecilomyces variotii]RWQ94968.1 hypothetical protein C8Q69DRAFT_468420 [Paecilomyces variotii]
MNGTVGLIIIIIIIGLAHSRIVFRPSFPISTRSFMCLLLVYASSCLLCPLIGVCDRDRQFLLSVIKRARRSHGPFRELAIQYPWCSN